MDVWQCESEWLRRYCWAVHCSTTAVLCSLQSRDSVALPCIWWGRGGERRGGKEVRGEREGGRAIDQSSSAKAAAELGSWLLRYYLLVLDATISGSRSACVGDG